MARALWLPQKAEDFGCNVALVPGWETRGSSAFNPKGVVVHHDAIPGNNIAGLKVCTHGRPGLAGPLCNVYLARDGTVYIVASGRANHAGSGGWKGLRGNSSVFGIEAANDGRGENWSFAQLDAYQRIVAAMLSGMGRGIEYVCGHKEWTNRKIDPYGIDMDNFRHNVALLLLSGGKPPVVDKVKPMYNPALQLKVVASLVPPDGKGVWILTEDGAIYAFGTKYYGGANGQAYFSGRKAATLKPSPVGGYIIVASSGEEYRYDPK